MNQLFRITLDTNPEDCNLHCIMCEEHSEYSHFISNLKRETGISRRRMPVHWLDRIIAQAKDLGVTEIIPSTMGEPLLYSGFDALLELCEKYSLKLNLTTNGTFPKKSMQDWAKRLIPICSDIKISWNGSTKETAEQVMKGISFAKSIQNLKELIKYRDEYYSTNFYYCRITLQLTFLQNNMQELKDIIQLAAILGVDRVKGHHLWTHFKEIENLSMKSNLQNRTKWNEYVTEAYQSANTYLKKDRTKVLLENIFTFEENLVEKIPDHYKCPFLEKELWISATGKISPCCAPDLQRQNLGDFGNIESTSLSEVLESKVYRNLVTNYKEYPLCQNCNMRKPTL